MNLESDYCKLTILESGKGGSAPDDS
jgi:hypothetical protein